MFSWGPPSWGNLFPVSRPRRPVSSRGNRLEGKGLPSRDDVEEGKITTDPGRGQGFFPENRRVWRFLRTSNHPTGKNGRNPPTLASIEGVWGIEWFCSEIERRTPSPYSNPYKNPFSKKVLSTLFSLHLGLPLEKGTVFFGKGELVYARKGCGRPRPPNQSGPHKGGRPGGPQPGLCPPFQALPKDSPEGSQE